MLIIGSKIALIGLAGLLLLFSNSCGWDATDVAGGSSRLTQDEKHRLYAAALAASESPLDTDLFKEVCKKIGIFDPDGSPNDNYMAFVSEHVDWGMKSQTDQFRHEIDSKDKAREYIKKHLYGQDN